MEGLAVVTRVVECKVKIRVNADESRGASRMPPTRRSTPRPRLLATSMCCWPASVTSQAFQVDQSRFANPLYLPGCGWLTCRPPQFVEADSLPTEQ